MSPAARALGLTSNRIAFDTEGTGLIPYGPPAYWHCLHCGLKHYPARPFAFAFCDDNGKTAYIRWQVSPHDRRVIPGSEQEHALIRNIITAPDVELIGHNIAYDFRMCKASGLGVPEGVIHDTQVLAHVVTAGDELTYALKPLSKKYGGFPDDDEKRLEQAVADARRGAKQKGWLIAIGKKEVEKNEHGIFAGNKPIKADYWLAPPALCQEYATGDVERAMLLFLLWRPELDKDIRAMGTYKREMDLFWVLRKMEGIGTRCYPLRSDYLTRWYRGYMRRMRALGDKHGGQGMNYNSGPQLGVKFYEERGYAPTFTETFNEKKGRFNYKIGKDQLAMIGAKDEDTGEYKDPLAKAILEYRAAHQSIKSFLNIYKYFWYPENLNGHPVSHAQIDRWTREVDEWHKAHSTWVIHPNYNQTGAVTGRMTCSDPNLQQVADANTGLRKADIPQRPRECFGPRPGTRWYLPDYSQVEVWCFAFMSGEKRMQEQLLAGHDFHAAIAKISFSGKEDFNDRPGYYRKLAKLIMFGKLYGGGVGTPEKPGRMTKLLQMDYWDAKAFIDGYDRDFEQVRRFMKEMVKEAGRKGEAFNLYGRRYHLEHEWAYKVVNYLIQGTCADVLKTALIRLEWMLQKRWPTVHILNSVHDEIIIEVPDAVHCQRLMREIIWVMQMDSAKLGLPVPLPVGMSITQPRRYQRWAYKTKVKLPPWVKGGVPRGDEARSFDALQRDMQSCPFLETRYESNEPFETGARESLKLYHSFAKRDSGTEVAHG